jgi:RNA-binding protein
VVIIGAKGLTAEVVAEIALALKAHELIKVRAPAHDRHARTAIFKEACLKTESELVQEIGKVAVLYKKRQEGD